MYQDRPNILSDPTYALKAPKSRKYLPWWNEWSMFKLGRERERAKCKKLPENTEEAWRERVLASGDDRIHLNLTDFFIFNYLLWTFGCALDDHLPSSNCLEPAAQNLRFFTISWKIHFLIVINMVSLNRNQIHFYLSSIKAEAERLNESLVQND